MEEYKIVVVGQGDVSQLTMDFLMGPTLNTAIDSYRKTCLVDDEPVILDIFTTAGQETYMAMREQYLRIADGILLVYSITDRSSFEEAISYRDIIRRVKDSSEEFNQVVLAANDCISSGKYEEPRTVGRAEGRDLSRDFGYPIHEISTKHRENIEGPFYDLVRIIRRNQKLRHGAGLIKAAALDGRVDELLESSKKRQGNKCVIS
ncbi:P-loop containing nucleoside triphosphate hydrolase protein [Crepidotus variabilis]|uniref:P-loop containing nucleoside triphosphate hydrolase protein n=1 Tax=Crepidotus variabilis TaxID=179855 RepID=A0A9P6E672_9AGAR|nr:P-loop containing nucleoside triphosphate hydrolase protein [Crepidotus variabilis]